MHSEKINILMTGGGAPGAAGILHCLKQEKNFHITVADAHPGAVGRWLHDDFVNIPAAGDDRFIETFLTICRQKNIQVVLPLVTRELLPLAQHKKEFEAAGTKIIVSPPGALAIANDKSRLYEFLQKNRIPVPDFRVAKTIHEFTGAAAALHFPEKDICFKPAVSNGSRGFRIISARINELDLMLNQKPASVYISYENAIRILSSGSFPALLVSEYLPGDEYSVDCLVKNGKTILAVPRLRIKTINGVSVEGEFVNDEALIRYCSSISETLQLHGNIGYQVKKSGTGELLILEINPRVQGAISSALGAGINLPVLAIRQELGLPVAEHEMQVNWGVKFSRYWSEVFH